MSGPVTSASYSSDAEIAELLQQTEVTFDLFEPSIDGTSAWQLLRFPVAGKLRVAPGSPGGGRSWDRPELIRRGMSDWLRYIRLPRAHILAKTFVSGLAEVQPDGLYRDVFFDDVLDVVGSHVKIEVQNARERARDFRGAHLPASSSSVGIDFGARILSRLGSSRAISDVSSFLSDVISSELGVSGFDPESIERRLLAFRWGRRLYGRVLDRVQPAAVLVADTGEFELFAAAKERGIRCVELQHGIFNRHHPHALGASAAAHRERLVVPDALLLFGSYWADELRAGGFYGSELRVAGSPRVDRFRTRRDVGRRSDDGLFRILVTSQGIAVEELARFLAEMMSLARTTGYGCRLDLKLHPIYDSSARRIYEEILAGAGGVRILANEDQPSTFDLLSAANAHVSISSACHYEALGIGVPTIVLPLGDYEQVLPLVEAGHAALAATPAELLRLLGEARDLQVSEEVSARYYQPGALQTIARELGHLSAAGVAHHTGLTGNPPCS